MSKFSTLYNLSVIVVQLLSYVQLLQPHGLQHTRLLFVHAISQARILEWSAISSSRGSSQPRDQTCISHTVGGFFTTEPDVEGVYIKTPPHTVHGVLEA